LNLAQKNFDVSYLDDINLEGTIRDRYFEVISKFVVNDGDFFKAGIYYFATFAYYLSSRNYREFFLNAILNSETGKKVLFRNFKNNTNIGISASLKNYIYVIISPDYIDMAIDKNSSMLDDKSKELLNRVSENDNPYIIKYEIK